MTEDDNIYAINIIELFPTTMITAAVSVVPAAIVPMTIILSGGRPKGTTQMASASMQRKIEECIVQLARKQVDLHLPANIGGGKRRLVFFLLELK